MLNEKKVSLMTKLAIAEQEKKQDFKINRFYASDYVRYNILKTIISVTLGYVLLLILYAFYHAEYLIQQGTELNWEYIGTTALYVYLFLIVIYTVATVVVYTVRYYKSTRVMRKYAKHIKMLQNFYDGKDGELK